MSVQNTQDRKSKPSRFRPFYRLIRFLREDSLQKSVLVAIIIVALIPVGLVGAVSYYRTRAQIESLVANQLSQISNNSSRQIESFTQTRQDTLQRLIKDPAFTTTFETSLNPFVSRSEATTAVFALRNLLFTTAQGTSVSEPIFSQLFILDESGTVVASSDSQFIYDNFGTAKVTHPAIKPLIGQTRSTVAFNPFRSTRDGLVLISTQVVVTPNLNHTYTLIGVSPTLVFYRVLEQAVAFLPGARAFYRNPAGEVFTTAENNTLVALPALPSFEEAVAPYVDGTATKQPFTFSSYDAQEVLAYVQNIPALSLSLVLQVPTSELFGQVPLLDRSILTILLVMLIALATITYVGTNRVIEPLLQLSHIAEKYAEGNFQDRIQIKRKDEIGQLATSMNKMAEELAVLYSNLEGQVEQRTSQLRVASEVAQIVTSSSRLEDILLKTVNLVTERFNLYSTAIFLTDEVHRSLVLREMYGTTGRDFKREHTRFSLDSNTPAGWAATHNRPRYLPDVRSDPTYPTDKELPYCRSMIAIPITVGTEVLGVMEVYSAQVDGLDVDLQFVIQTIANQVAGAIQNTRLLESTQVNLEETAQLYRLTRLVTSAETEQDATNQVINGIAQLQHVTALLSVTESDYTIQALYDPRTRKLELDLSSIKIPVSKSYEIVARGEPVYIEDFTRPSEFHNILSFFLRRGCRSAVILPCMRTGKPVQLLVVGFYEGEKVTQASIQPYTNLAEVISATLDKFNVLQTLQHRLAELQVLANFSRATSAETNLQQLYRTLHQLVTETLGEDLGFILALVNPDQQIIEFPYAYENLQKLDLEPIPVGSGLTSLVIENRKPLLLTNETERRALELGAHIVGRPAKSWLGVPLIAGGLLIGALVIQDQDQEQRFDENDLNLLMTLAPQIATAIRNAQLVEELHAALATFEQERIWLNSWFENSPDAIIVKDEHGAYQRVSASFARMFGLKPEDLTGKTDFDLFTQEEASSAYEIEQTVFASNQPRLGDVEQVMHDGTPRWDLVSRIPVLNFAGEATGLLVIRRNITEMVRAETVARERAEQIRTTAEIARDAAGILDLDELLGKAVNLIRERFGFYHASVFLLDSLSEYAVLRESTGEAGRQMKINQHRLAVGSRSIVGQATALGQAVIAHDVTTDPNHHPNPLLPNTRAELALPLIFAGKVIGALDVQSEQPNAFAPEDIEILGILADQLAATIHNAELFAAAQSMLGKHRLLHQINLAASTASDLRESLEKSVAGLQIAKVADRTGIWLLNRHNELELAAFTGYLTSMPALRIPLGEGPVGMAAAERRPVRINNAVLATDVNPEEAARSLLALPVLFGEELIGVLSLESKQPSAFDENDQDIMVALANNIGAIIANWRLVEQIRRQVERQQTLFEITSKIRRSVDIPTILQTSVQEIGRALPVKKAQIALVPPGSSSVTPDSPAKNGSNGHKETP
ncbi:MAG TPA: PAS domain S-box protein [Anaerolinea thermolimosa]|mgnify:CR=1 FL=1|uniref:PAS domain S-box protein n=1 Tax=Anaerolinea thermolimosa TaxID=229919 RepID=A0A3D1JHZ5_9CHLR|nr:GAF domain-containing protein [Anaerolinea thermolimosa]GAP06289.1 protein containing PAS domain S-box [Anaerolinea thermolimosa]HCE17867.1 PAS domain S-box protein [Anaerolinea thermolimosa]